MSDQNPTSNIIGQGRPDYQLPYRSGDDRPKTRPFAPFSVNVTSPYLIGLLDIRWDNPALYTENNGLQVLGVNIYRALDAPGATYTKLNDAPVSILHYRDATSKIHVIQENVLPCLNPGNNAEKKWFFHTQHKPIMVFESNGNQAVTPDNITVEIDAGDGKGYQVVPAFKVVAEQGLVYLNTNRTYDPQKNIYVDAVLPNLISGGIRVSYYYLNGLIATDMNRKLYYKVTTVAYDPDTQQTLETPLNEVSAVSPYDMERVDWIWAEAIRRNHWLLEQTGERVKLFLRKWNGQLCSCYDPKMGYSKGIGLGSGTRGCPICYGTSYVGGYEGPFDILIAPPETEKAVNLMDAGLHITYDWNTWTSPDPLINDRDVIVRRNNDRFFTSRVNPQGSRGAIYQQHLNLAQIDQSDPVYDIPIYGGSLVVPPGWNAYREGRATDASPELPIKPEIQPGKLPIGRTVTFENLSS